MAEVANKSGRAQASNPNRGSKPGERRGGRKAGTPNKVTATTKEAITALVDGAAPKLAGWLDAVAKDDPRGALEIVARMASLVMPRPGVAVGGGVGLEALVVLSAVPEPDAGAPAFEPPLKPSESLPASRPAMPSPSSKPVAAAPPPFRMSWREPDDASEHAATDYDPLTRN